MPSQSNVRLRAVPKRPTPTLFISRLRKPLAAFLALLLFFQLTVPALAQSPPASPQTSSTQSATSSPAAPRGHGAPAEPPGQGTPPQGPQDTPAATRARTEADPPTATFTVDAFQTDLFTGAATAEIPIVVPPGTAGVAPKIALRYNSVTVDDLGPRDQGAWTGLGWTLDVGGFVLRDTKLTTSPNDDTFKLVFGGGAHDLVLIDAGQNIYHTKDETFWRLQYNPQEDYWTLTTKDGTTHRFGYNGDSKAMARGQDLMTPVVYKYMLDEVTKTGGVSVRYTYAKQTATIPATGQTYDQAIYPDTISYTYHNGALVGPAREVRFLRAPRSDYTDTSATTNVSFFERDRLDAIEVRVASNLVRKYVLSHDYWIDRDPSYTWGGGATGDLTLRYVTQYGRDGTSALPSMGFSYNTGYHLTDISNGIGGSVAYHYEVAMSTVPLYSVYKLLSQNNCVDFGVSLDSGEPACSQYATLVGHAVSTNRAGTVPIYSVFKDTSGDNCRDYGVSTGAGAPGCEQHASLQGYALTTSVPGTIPLYSAYMSMDGDNCTDWGVRNDAGPGPCQSSASLLGYVWLTRVNRYRVVSRTVRSGLGSTEITTTFNYGTFALSSDGREFRGHDWVRAVDSAGHYTDTWFKQDDALRGRAYQVETRRSDGALFTKVVNTWSGQGIWPGTTFASLDRTDVYTCDGDASCKQTAQTFQYDGYGNTVTVQHLGDVAVSGDERTEVTEYFPNTTAYIVGLPAHTSIRDATGSTVAQTWLHYDGAASHTTPPTLGRLTKRCQWLNGGANPCVSMTHDPYGNVLTATDPRGNTTTTVYDPTYRTFPETVTTPPTPNVPGGLVTASTHDPRFGVVLAATDPNGQTTTNQYDVFGRLTSVTNALNETRTISYDNIGSPGYQRVRTVLPDGSPDGLWTEEYFDGLGRTWLVRKRAAAGQVVSQDTVFDTRGLVSQKSLPHFEGVGSAYTTFTYDPLGRPTQTTFPDGTTETLAYNDWTVTFTDRNGRVRTTAKDAYGRTVRVTEPGGAVTQYAYDAMGWLTSVTDAASPPNVTTILYDTLGRKTQMTEPNMGTWFYAYDANGNLTSQTDAKGQTLLFTYDALNRLTTKTYPALSLVALTGGSLSWPEGYAALYRGGICVADGTGNCISGGGDARAEAGLGPRIGFMKRSAGADTLPLYKGLCYSDGTGACTAWGLSLDVNGAVVGYLTTSAPDQGSANAPFVQSRGLLVQGLEPTPSDLILVPLTRSVKSWFEGYTALYRGGVCVADATGTCIGGDAWVTQGTAPAIGYMKNASDTGTVPLYQGVCYSNATGTCTAFSLNLDVNGSPVGYLSQTAPDSQSQNAPFIQSGGLLLQGLTGTPSAYVWTTPPPASARKDHVYVTDGSVPSGYTSDGLTAYLRQSDGAGTAAVTRYVNATTGSHYYSTAADPPSGYTEESILGYADTTQGAGMAPLARHYNAATNDYLLETSTTPPAGYTYQATLGYVRLDNTPPRYLWANLALNRTDHLYITTGALPLEYSSEGITGYLRQYPDLGTAPLVRYFNSATGSHYYSTIADAPSGYVAEATLGYVDDETTTGLVPLARHYNASTGDYLLETSITPPAGYTYQATLGYVREQGTPQPRVVAFTYDTGVNGKGRRSGMTDLVGAESYTYDALGRTTSATRTTDGVAYTSQTTYTSFGPPDTMTYPDGEAVRYTYEAGRVTSVATVGGPTYVSSMAYDASGQVTQINYGNGAVARYIYSSTTLRLDRLETNGGSLQNLSYSYDNVGNVTTITDTRDAANNQTFTYDTLNRLQTATGPYGTQSYTYSAIGNILTKAGVTYTYGATAQTCNRLMPHAVTGTSDGKSYSYDCNGNMVSDGERTIAWDADNKPVSITRTGVGTTEFGYSGDGARVKKIGPERTIRYVGGFEDHVTETVQIKHISAGPLRVATKVTGGINAGTFYLHGDHLGSLNVLTNSNGAEVQRLTYQPFGETHANTGTVDFLQRRFTGQEQDPETGLYFYHARYYNPILGRFISPDSIVPNPLQPQSLNRYSYVINNPLRYTDPSGHFFFELIMAVVVGTAIGAGTGAGIAAATGGDVGKGALVGAVGGAILGPAGWGANALYQAGYSLASAALLTAGGAAAGSASAAAAGTNPGTGAAYGAGFALASWFLPNPSFQPFGNSLNSRLANVGNQIFNDSIRGAAIGATHAAIEGRNIAQGALFGALTLAGGSQFNNLIGHMTGLVATGFQSPEFRRGAFIYQCTWCPGAITLGNTITIDKSIYDGAIGNIVDPVTGDHLRDARSMEILEHEYGHVRQYQGQGGAFLPIYAIQMPFVAITGYHPFVYNAQEVYGLGSGVMTGPQLYNYDYPWFVR